MQDALSLSYTTYACKCGYFIAKTVYFEFIFLKVQQQKIVHTFFLHQSNLSWDSDSRPYISFNGAKYHDFHFILTLKFCFEMKQKYNLYFNMIIYSYFPKLRICHI